MYINSLKSNIGFANWRNPISAISDPLHQRWAEICQTMATHIDGICPLHIYVNRRPLESENTYALDYRINNFTPLTKDAFDRSINSIIEYCLSANIGSNIPELITNNDYKIKGKEVYFFCQSDLVRLREKDPNAVIVVIPSINKIDENSVSINNVNILFVPSSDILDKTETSISFIVSKTKDKEVRLSIVDGQYTAKVSIDGGNFVDYPLVSLAPRKPYIDISSNIVYEGKYKLALPYMYGASAWGDKFYGQESDFSVQATRYTYLKEIRAKERCDEAGAIFKENGLHCYADNDMTCRKCGGTGYVKDDSPLGTIYVDYSKLNAEDRAFPQVIQWAEPPQAALTSSKEIVSDYFEKMCEALGLIKQNYTNQSGVSKAFDFKDKISTIYKIFNDNINVAQDIYRFIEYFLIDETVQYSELYLIGEIGTSTMADLLNELDLARKGNAPTFIISSILDKIYLKSLPPNIAERVLSVAKQFDKLYIYSTNDITMLRAQFGTQLTEYDLIVHNTIIEKVKEVISNNHYITDDELINELNTFYSQYKTSAPTYASIGLL